MLGRVRRKNRVLPFVMLGLLVAINAYLVILLLLPERGLVAEPGGQSMGQPSPSGTTEDASSPRMASPSATSSASGGADVEPVKRLLVAASDQEAWRATVGHCEEPGIVERSTDGGQTWNRVIDSGLAPITRLGIEDGGDLFMVGGTGKSCSARYAAYSADGVMVAETINPQDVWYLDPADPNQVHGPSRTSATPCEMDVVGIATLDLSEALVVCSNGSMMVTSDSGESWEEADQLPGAMAVASGGGRYWIARTTKSCDGLSIRSLTLGESDLSRGPNHCSPSRSLSAEGVAIDVSRETIWLWEGNRVRTSTDGGRSWS